MKVLALLSLLLLVIGAPITLAGGPIKTVVVVVMENRSFDHMLGWMKRLNPEIDGVTGSESNPVSTSDPNSPRVFFKDGAHYVDPDPGHSFQAIREQIFGSNDTSASPAPMNGFAQQAGSMSENMTEAVMNGFRPEMVAVYKELVSEFAVYDRWFAAVPASTQPNRLYVHSATSHGATSNNAGLLAKGYPQRTIFENLDDAGLSFGIYYQNVPAVLFYRNLRKLKYITKFHSYDLEFKAHCRKGSLPNYAVIEQRYMDSKSRPATDDHPSHDVYQGQMFIKEIYESLRTSPQWNQTLMIITYDEHGGFYDHVPTPKGVPSPDGIVGPDPFFFQFDRLGVRVPTIMVSPWIEKGTVVHGPNGVPTSTSEYEHSSIPATVKKIFDLQAPYLTKRDAWAGTFEGIVQTRTEPRTDCPGIGWKSWKKRWFILTRTSLVFFKNDPSALPQRGGEVNLTLGGIDLNNSGSVVVREDKKLLTVLFPDGRDGRAFSLKAETSEDLFEWKTALELALAQAPNAALVMGHNGIFRNDNADAFEGSVQTWRGKRPIKSLVVGRPILLALEDIDGRPSFLEKALRFLEKYGIKVEGILRQSADVEEVDRRVQEYEQGRTEFTSDEDAHVVGDCVKHVLRELPSSPVPASCCTALLEAYRLEHKEARVNAMRSAISETFPEPNRRLLQRVLKMMHTIAAHTAENRMTASAVAACMAPLLLRPLLAGECELEDDFDMNDDSSAQLLAAANAANNAQAIITTLLEEYENIFDDDNLHRCSFSPDSPIDESGSEESMDDGKLDSKDNGYHDSENVIDPEMVGEPERVLSGKLSESSGYAGSDLYDIKVFAADDSDAESPKDVQAVLQNVESTKGSQDQYSGNGSMNTNHENSLVEKDIPSVLPTRESTLSMGEILSSFDSGISFPANINEYCVEKHPDKVNGSNSHGKRSNFWGRNNAKKSQSVESVDSSGEEELAIQRLEITKNDLRMRIAKEAKGNAILQASLERRKQALHERRLALEQDVSRLQEQLQAERDLRAALEVGLSISSGQFSSSRSMDSKTRAELEEIALAEADVARLKQKVAELHLQLNQQRQDQYGSFSDDCNRYQHLATNLSPQKVVQQDFDLSLAYCNHEKKQRSEESSSETDWRSIKPHTHPYSSIKQLSWQRSFETGLEATSGSEPNSAAVGSTISKPSAEGVDYHQRQSSVVASSTLVELTTRLDFFKERRSQLMEQLQNLDLNHGTPSLSQGSAYRPSPPWNNSPR